MIVPRLVLLAAVGVGAWPSAAPAQDRDQAGQAKAGRLVGRVTAADTGRAIMRAQVAIIRASETRPLTTTVTNDAGFYSFEQLPGGRYTVLASKPGIYLDTFHGRTAPEMPAKLVRISAGNETHVDIALARAGAISGHVFDDSGEPLAYASVVARSPAAGTPLQMVHTNSPTITISSTGGFTRVTQPAGAITNDRGEFRLFGLAAGEYVLWANAQPMQGDKRRYASLYYPGVLDAASADRITLMPGQDVVNVDFTLRLVPRVMVSGIALTPEGDPIRGGTLSLYPAGSHDMVLGPLGSIKTDGTFMFETVAGHYVLRVRYSSIAAANENRYQGTLSASYPMSVGAEDITDLVLKLTRGATITGQYLFEGSGRPADMSRFSVSVQSGGPGEVIFGVRQPDGSFALRGIELGPRRVSAYAPAGWMVKGIYLNGRDIVDEVLDLTDDVTLSGVTVVFTDALTRVQVAVQHGTSEDSSIVVLFPENAALLNERRIAVRAVSAEPVTIEGLPVGEYLAVAISDAALGSLERPDAKLLERLRPTAKKLQIAHEAAASVALRAMPLPR